MLDEVNILTTVYNDTLIQRAKRTRGNCWGSGTSLYEIRTYVFFYIYVHTNLIWYDQ